MEEIKNQETNNIFVDDVIEDLELLKVEIAQKRLNEDIREKIKRLLRDIEFLELLGVPSKDEENKQCRQLLENDYKWHLLYNKAVEQLEKVKKLKAHGKEVVRITNSSIA